MLKVASGPRIYCYWVSLATFLASLAMLLLTLVDMRRGILFPLGTYHKLGAPSALLYFDPRHLLLLSAGCVGIWLSYRSMMWLEGSVKAWRPSHLKRLCNVLALSLMAALVADLFAYRIVPARRIVGAGKIGVGRALPIDDLPAWLQPLGEATNYFLLVWHATVLGIFIGALMLILVTRSLRPMLEGSGFRSHVAGAALAMPYPFCSCCAAPVGATFFRAGASLGPALAFVVSSPMLNVTSLTLAVALLPTNFALLRIVGGLLVGVFLTYLVSRLATRWAGPAAPRRPLLERPSRVLEAYGRLFRFEDFLQGRPVDSPGTLISAWLALAWRLARVALPVLFVGAIVSAAVMEALPSYANNSLGVVVAAAFGTILMIPTWTEIAVAGPLIEERLDGPAAALLLTLPAVSIPSLAIIAGALNAYRVTLLLGLTVFAVGVLGGFVFLVV